MDLYQILRAPEVTEKSNQLLDQKKNQTRYVFKVAQEANKESVRQAIYQTYRVRATKINIMRIGRKLSKFRNTPVASPRGKKAIVTLAQGQKIELVKV